VRERRLAVVLTGASGELIRQSLRQGDEPRASLGAGGQL
jgi:hypothetical protein